MTSWERKAGNEYGDDVPVKEPPYATFSYTWGRFECCAGEALSIANLAWVVPSITPGHFSAYEFQHIINEIATVAGVKYLWLDIACISQEHRSLHAEEVGRQKDIFQNSTLGFVWLNTFNSYDLSSLLDRLEDVSLHIVEKAMALPPREKLSRTSSTEKEDILRTASGLITRLVKDPWFSSLWTLQEAFANPDAILLSMDRVMSKELRRTRKLPIEHVLQIVHEDGNLPHVHTYENSVTPESSRKEVIAMQGSYTTLRWLVTVCQNIHNFFSPVQHDLQMSQHCLTILEHLKRNIESVGLSSFASVNYNKVFDLARFRYEACPGDRIHGIMHVYGFSTDDLVDHCSDGAHHARPVADLDYGFACALLQHHPVLSQLYVRTSAPELNQSWRMDEFCNVPDFDIFINPSSSPVPLCAFSTSNTSFASFTGTACAFRTLGKWWLSQMSIHDCTQSEQFGYGTLAGMVIDEGYIIGEDLSRTRCPILVELPRRRPNGPHGEERWLISSCDLSANLLRYLDLLSKADVRVLPLGTTKTLPSFSIGLVLLHRTPCTCDINEEAWQRLGLVFWVFTPSTGSVETIATEAMDNIIAGHIERSPLSGRLT